MKVKQFLSGTKWTPGSGYAKGKPTTVSILLPTFRRGRDGMFLRAVNSILGQSLKDIELIIIDDASTDGTADLIIDIMNKDPRVSCLQHQANVGLPAISEYEAYMKSRGSFIGFAFDDFLFEFRAFESIVDAMEKGKYFAAFGRAALRIGGDSTLILGDLVGPSAGLDKLQTFNFIANSSMVLRREVIEEVGLYDPHISASRLCDWDLWQRILRKYQIKALDIFVGQELGAARPDSLGRTYPLHPETMQEFFSDDRDRLLTPQNFPERDVLTPPPFASIPLQYQNSLSAKHFSSRSWYNDVNIESNTQPRKVITILSDFKPADIMLWGFAPNSDFLHMTWLDGNIGRDYQDNGLLRADAVIMSPRIGEEWVKKASLFCLEHKIPVIYYLDEATPGLENFLLDRSQGALSQRSNFEDAFEDGLIKGWAYEEVDEQKASVLEIAVDGELIDIILSNVERGDLREAGLGEGKHAFFFQLPDRFQDGREHSVDVRWASNHTPLANSPRTVTLSYQAEKVDRQNLSPKLDIEQFRNQLRGYHAVLVGSEALRDELSPILPQLNLRVARPTLDLDRLERQRKVRKASSRRSKTLHIALPRAAYPLPFENSELAAAFESSGLDVEIRCSDSYRPTLRNVKISQMNGSPDFGSSLDEFCEWLVDIAVVPPRTAYSDAYRSDADILYCLYMGATPIVPDAPCFADWNEESGVYRVQGSKESWIAALRDLADPAMRRKSNERLETACRDRFSPQQRETLLGTILENIGPLDPIDYFGRYRSL